MIQTPFGPVGLRKPREQLEIGLHNAGGSKVTIQKQWLQEKAKKNLDDYRLCVKQAMLIAATRMEYEAVTMRPQDARTETGQQMTAKNIEEKKASLKQKMQAMQDGLQPVPMKRLSKGDAMGGGHGVALQGKRLDKHLLVKRSYKCGMQRKRYFNIDDGKLMVYKQDRPNMKAKHIFDLKEVICRYENKKTPGLTEQFLPGYEDRIFIQCKERPHGPMYLYAKDPKEAKSWQRAIIMSKYLLVPSDREALAVVVGRVVGNIAKKGWDALLQYSKEILTTRQMVKSLAMRLTRLELSRGWNKVRLVYQQQVAQNSLRKEQQEWAAKFLKEKMDRINQQSARSPAVVRRTIISQIQTKFRHFREEKIFDRMYPLGSAAQTRLQQALGGRLLDITFGALPCEDALLLLLKGEGQDILGQAEGLQILQGRKSSYSEIQLNTVRASVSVSDSLTMLSFAEQDDKSENANLSKAGWAHFVNLDSISSVVLHSQVTGDVVAEKMKKLAVADNLKSGTWMTLNGPRVSWCKGIQTGPGENGQEIRSVVGTADGLAVGAALAGGQRTRWFRIQVNVQGSNVPRPGAQQKDPAQDPNAAPGDDPSQLYAPPPKMRKTYLVINFLGKQFSTKDRIMQDEKPQFRCQFTAEVPISGEDGLPAFDETELGVEVVEYEEDASLSYTSWAGKMELWKLFLHNDHPSLQEVATNALHTAQDYAHRVGIGKMQKDKIIPLGETLQGGRGQVTKSMQLVDATASHGGVFQSAYIDLQVAGLIVDPAQERDPPHLVSPPISPELQGRGQTTSLWTNQRGSWYDPKLGMNKFIVDHVANFAEIRLDALGFPSTSAGDDKLYRYHVEAKCNGVTVTSIALHRARAEWAKVMPLDPVRINFYGNKLFVPLPPGCWCSEQAPAIELVVLRTESANMNGADHKEFFGRARPVPNLAPQKVYHGIVKLDRGEKELLVDQTRGNVTVAMNVATERKAETGLGSGTQEGTGANPASLTFSITLRDRDYVRLNRAMTEEHGWKPQGVLAVGDKALLRVEEQLLYPKSELEYRHRFFPGKHGEPQFVNGSSPGAPWTAPLREPSMSHEWTISGFERLETAPQFKQKYIPTHCDNIVPCKYVLPLSEAQFVEESKAGSWHRVLDEICKTPADQNEALKEAQKTGRAPVHIVEKLSHLNKNVPVTVIAVYANGTCDIEVAPYFMHEWAAYPDRKYCFPGRVNVTEHKDESLAYMRAAPRGTGDVGQQKRQRVFLQGVPLSFMKSVQPASFNVYDAAFNSVEEAMALPPAESRNDFNPRIQEEDQQRSLRDRRGAYSISAGPVPADAGAACLYEWSLHLHMPTEDDMYQFVTMLRQCTRMDLAAQVKKMQEYKKKSSSKAKQLNYVTGPTLTTNSGTLEVVLVEARHLKPIRFSGFKDREAMLKAQIAPDFSPFVQFELSNDAETTLLKECKEGEMEFAIASQENFLAGPQVITINPGAANAEDVIVTSFAPLLPANEALPRQARFVLADGQQLRFQHMKGELVVQKKEALVYRGSKMQSSPAIQGSNNPNWASLSELKSSGGWIFKSPFIEPTGMKNLAFELKVQHKGVGGLDWPIGSVRVPVTGGRGDAAVPVAHLCDPKAPFNNLWLPLYTEVDGKRSAAVSGEIHVLTLWIPKVQTGAAKRLPKTARAFLQHELRPKQMAAHVREPVYDLPLKMQGYNANVLKNDDFPPTVADCMSRKTEKVFTGALYLECRDRQQVQMWTNWLVQNEVAKGVASSMEDPETALATATEAAKLKIWPRDFYWMCNDKGIVVSRKEDSVAKMRFDAVHAGDKAAVYDITDLLRRGIPGNWRKDIWMDITNANLVMAQSSFMPQKGPQNYVALVKEGRPYRSDAMLQLHEDLVGAAAWETSTQPAVIDIHLQRLKRAQDVCIALITFTQIRPKGTPPPEVGVLNYIYDKPDKPEYLAGQSSSCPISYCESLLVLAFFLLLPQGPPQGKMSKMMVENQKVEDESRAFWMLYTLISSPANQMLREYFGSPPGFPRSSAGDDSNGPDLSLTERSGAMEDVFRLDRIISRWEKELWLHLHALGFQLPTVFYGAFMRLFAFMLPTASLFRFWDHLFSESTKPNLGQRPRRHVLLDFSYAVLRSCKDNLLKCQSSLEAKDCIVNCIENLDDPDEVIKMTIEAEAGLWVGKGNWQEKTGLLLHNIDFQKGCKHYDVWLDQFRKQNAVLHEITRSQKCMLPKDKQAVQDKRITTRNVVNIIMPTLQNLLMGSAAQAEADVYGGMFRQTTAKILEDSPEEDSTLAGTLFSMARMGVENLNVFHLDQVQPSALAHGLPPPPNSSGEPKKLDKATLANQISRGQLGDWPVEEIWKAFESREESGRVSLNEFFQALIACSKGTVGDKALALFHLYASHNMDSPQMHHIQPVTHYSKAVVEKVEGAVNSGHVFSPPPPEEVDKKTALHFRIFVAAPYYQAVTNNNTSKADQKIEEANGLLLGEVYIPTLKPFKFSGMAGGKDNPQKFTIWGTKMTVPTGYDGVKTERFRPPIGELHMSIKWIPSNRPASKGPNYQSGQLGVHIYSVIFNEARVEAPYLKNPKVVLSMYPGEEGKSSAVPIKRWDPRGLARQVASALTMEIEFGGAYGGNMEWQETMYRNPFGKLQHRIAGGNQGWNQDMKAWQWSSKWGDQYSDGDIEMRKEFVETKQRATTISLQACRIITAGLLQRSLTMMTNRQMALFADSCFNRAGAVPAILDAVLVKGVAATIRQYGSIEALKADKHAHYIDVKHTMLHNCEYNSTSFLGSMDIFPKDARHPGSQEVNIHTLKPHAMKDPYHMHEKTLWIRYARSGDGERYNKFYAVASDGKIQGALDFQGNLVADLQAKMDMPKEVKASQQSMFISKEEFVSCILASPVLSESLRQLSTSDVTFDNGKTVPIGNAIKLEITIADPSKKEADQEFMDTMTVGQSLLIELWDLDRLSKHDFLGECWLPNLATIGPNKKNFVLPIRNVGMSEGGTRPDTKKQKITNCTGDLFVEASWTFPAEREKAEGMEATNMEDRVKKEELLHTGELHLKIVKAKGLRYADVRRSKGSDPYCIVYMRNDTYSGENEGWKVSPLTGAHQEVFKTKWIKNTIDPEYNEEAKIRIMTGAFEKRTKMKLTPAFTARQRQRELDDRAIKVLKDQEELKVFFGDLNKEAREQKKEMGARHDVKVYLGETIHQFKVKLMAACQQEALKIKEDMDKRGPRNEGNQDELTRLEDSRMQFQSIAEGMSFRHAVMVFVPSAQLRELAQQGRTNAHEYKRLYNLENQDPSNWQPLDPIRTFNHYAATYGFGMEREQRLRISEGSDDYKLRNHRYRQFEEEQKSWGVTLPGTNSDKQCFGWARYKHENDGGSTEWRPALVGKPEASGKEAALYKTQFAFAIPGRRGESTTGDIGAAGLSEELREEDVLLAPMLPAIMGSNCLQHQEFLKQANEMHEAGKKDADIAKELTAQMQAKYGSQARKDGVPPPPPITISEVSHYLRALQAGSVTVGLATSMEAPVSMTDEPLPTPAQSPAGPAGPAGPSSGARPGGGPGIGAGTVPAGPSPAGPGMGPGGPGRGPAMSGGPALSGGPGSRAGPALSSGPRPGGSGPSMGPGARGPGGPGGGGVSMGPSSMN
eukprot:TRINITY_DN100533_c0_g1_i1.p1 TRINITY_DN100533_c0_g1~~TRINITY_DN100533_c0_g1_i1.p1  ORF type:complete len:3625 (-),score=1181.40 TRINITY_DN100533_c0_g1_i1:304-11178(-)